MPSGWLITGALAFVAGCAGTVPPQVVRVASHDLGCESVEVAELGGDRFAASGCGRGAVYAQLCQDAECRWGRLRHGHEESIAYGQPQAQGTREVLPAPPPASREIQPAPPPQPRQVIPAPAPAGSSGLPGGAEPGAEAPTNVTPATSATPADSPLLPGAAPVALSEGELSAPYEAQVPVQPVAQQVTQAPPAPLIETRPPPPARNYVWISGWWWWGTGASWLWVPGYWGPGYYGYNYIPGGWYWGSGYWWYGPGGWARPGTTVIINRNLPPRPRNTAVVRSFTPHRVSPSVQNRGAHRVVQQAPRGGFSPRGSPLNTPARVTRPAPSSGGRYYSPSSGGARYGTPSTSSRYGAPGVGRVVSPDSVVRPRSYSGGGSAPRGGSYSAPRSYGGGGYSAPRGGSYPAPRGGGGGGGYSAPRGGGGGGYSAPRGGGGGGYSAPRGGGGGGGSTRVSPGGGGGGGRRGR